MSPWRAALLGVAIGVAGTWLATLAWLAGARAETQRWQEATAAVYRADTARLAAEGRARAQQLAALAARADSLDRVRARDSVQTVRALAAEGTARRTRDSVMAALALTAEQAGVLAQALTVSDQAHDAALTALTTEATGLRVRLRAELDRSAVLTLALAADSAVARRHVARIAELEAAAARRLPSRRRLDLGCAVGPALTAAGAAWLGVACGLTLRR